MAHNQQALQLLEFLVKNGSERVVDDARSHLSLIRMLKQFHYIDQNGKDQGVNVRNRSGELVKLLSDVDAIRAERKKSRANKNKYGGVAGGGGSMGFSSGAGGRYGGFGSESAGYGGYQGEVYGDGGGFGGRETDFSGTQRRGDQFEEYDAEEEEGGSTSAPRRMATAPPKQAPPKKAEPVPDLFDFGEDELPAVNNGKAPDVLAADDDDFDDFQSAASPAVAQPTAPFGGLSPPPKTSTTTSATQFAAPQPIAPSQAVNLNSLFPSGTASPSIVSPPPSNVSSPPPQPHSTPIQPAPYKPSGPNYYTSVNSSMNTGSSATSAFTPRPTITSNQPSYASSTSAATLGKPTAKASTGMGGDAFGNLWSSASTKAGVQNKPGAKGPDLASMAKAKSEAGIWGAAAAPSQPRPGAIAPSPNTAAGAGRLRAPLGNGLDDLLG